MLDIETVCCFCGETIKHAEHNQAVLLTATNLLDHWSSAEEPRFQSYFAHTSCLVEYVPTKGHPWEVQYLTDPH